MILLNVVGGVLAGWRALKDPTLRLAFDGLLLRIPLLGRLIRDLHAARMARTLGTMVASRLPLLDGLKARGHLLAVATGKSRRGLDEALQSAELKGVFDGSRTADETAGKPDPRTLHELMAQFDLPAERVLMIRCTRPHRPLALHAAGPTGGRGLCGSA